MLWSSFLQKQALTAKELFGKVPGRSAGVLKKDSTLDVSLGSLQILWEQLFFDNTNGLMLPKIQVAFFWNTSGCL